MIRTLKNILLIGIAIIITCCSTQHKKSLQYLGYTKDGVQGYTHFQKNEPFAIYSNFYDTCFIRMVDLEPEQEAGYMVTILDKKNDFFHVRFNYPDIGTAWIKKGNIGLNIRGLASYEDKNVIPIRKKPRLKSCIIGTLTIPQHVQILDEKKHWVYIKAIDAERKDIEGWLAPVYQCGDPYTTCP